MERHSSENQENGFEEEEPCEPIPVCTCLRDDVSSEKPPEPSKRIEHILSTVTRTETYLQERRIPEMIRFILTKLISDAPHKPMQYIEKLLDDCMLFRAGLGVAPVLYERRHLEAIVKSFDPGNRGWLSAGQVRRAYTTIGLTPDDTMNEQMSTDDVLNELEIAQEEHLFKLVAAGSRFDHTQSSDTNIHILSPSRKTTPGSSSSTNPINDININIRYL